MLLVLIIPTKEIYLNGDGYAENVIGWRIKIRSKEEILQGEDEKLFLTSCYFDIVKFATRILGKSIKPFHREWLDVIRSNQHIAIGAPTGFGKTTIFGIVYPLWLAYYKPNSQTLIVSKTVRNQSASILETIKEEIESNEILKQLIPENTDKTWSKEKIVMTNGAKIMYSSNTINVRGIHVDYLFADEVATYPDHELFFRDVVTRINSKKGKLAAVSTFVNTNDLLVKLMNTQGYFKKVYPAIIDKEGLANVDGESIWPEQFPKQFLLDERIKSISNFEKNYQCNPRAETEDPVFSIGSVEACYDGSRIFTSELKDGGQCYIGCDFAISNGPDADFDCYIVVERTGDYVVILHGERHKGYPIPAKLDRLRELNQIYNPIRFVMDESNVGTAIVQTLRSEGLPIEVQSFQSNARRKLLVDLKGLIENKKLVIPRNLDCPFTSTFINKLTEELIAFKDVESRITKTRHLVSSAAHDDTVMALGMACKGTVIRRQFDDFVAYG